MSDVDTTVKQRPRKHGQVHALPGADRPEDALKRLHEALSSDDEKPRGVILVTVSDDGDCDVRTYGVVKLGEMTWSAAVLIHEATTP